MSSPTQPRSRRSRDRDQAPSAPVPTVSAPPASPLTPSRSLGDLPALTGATVGGPQPADDGAARAPRRAAGPRTEPGAVPWYRTIGAKLGAVTGALVLVSVLASVGLAIQADRSSAGYDALLEGEVRQSLTVRDMQVEFKQQVQEWKDILLRGYNPSDLELYKANFDNHDNRVEFLSNQVVQFERDPAVRAQLIQFRTMHRDLDTRYAEALAVFEASNGKDPRTADRMVRGLDRTPTNLLDDAVAKIGVNIRAATAAQRASAAANQRRMLAAFASLLVALVSILALALIRIVRPIRQLTDRAREVADERLPAAIAALEASDSATERVQLPAFEVATRDELSRLSQALTDLQDSALDQAIRQHRSDRETADMLVNLGRRNQNLLGRMLSYVTELERQEQDPEVLAQLFRLDHATTRIRRNAESMLVLAGATQTRTWSRPVPVVDVVRAALSEIEEYVRVDLHHLEDALVLGAAVADVVHLCAELIENATHFSPPTTQVTVVGQRVREGYRLRVVDQGVGMTRKELDAANHRITHPDAGWSDAKLLGLYVVGRLARRRRIEVTLEASAGRGITASILLPLSILAVEQSAAPVPGAARATTTLSPSPAVPAAPTVDVAVDRARPVRSSAAAAALPPSRPLDLPAARGEAPAARFEAPPARRDDRGPVVFEAPERPGPVPMAVVVPEEPSAPAQPPAGRASSGRPDSGAPQDRVVVDAVVTDLAPSAPERTPTAGPVAPVVPFVPAAPAPSPGQEPWTPEWPVPVSGQEPPVPVVMPAGGPWAPGDRPTPRGPVIDLTDGTAPGRVPPVVPAPYRGGADGPDASTAGIPRRVRGAQLPDLGPTAEPVVARPDDGPGAAESLRWQLRSFQLDVQAARRAINDGDPSSHRPTDRPTDRTDRHPEGE